MAKKPALVWDNWNREHIKKHKLTVAEVEECYAAEQRVKRIGKNDRPEYIAKLKNKRLIAIFVSFEKQSEPYVVSARDASVKERRIYYEKFP